MPIRCKWLCCCLLLSVAFQGVSRGNGESRDRRFKVCREGARLPSTYLFDNDRHVWVLEHSLSRRPPSKAWERQLQLRGRPALVCDLTLAETGGLRIGGKQLWSHLPGYESHAGAAVQYDGTGQKICGWDGAPWLSRDGRAAGGAYSTAMLDPQLPNPASTIIYKRAGQPPRAAWRQQTGPSEAHLTQQLLASHGLLQHVLSATSPTEAWTRVRTEPSLRASAIDRTSVCLLWNEWQEQRRQGRHPYGMPTPPLTHEAHRRLIANPSRGTSGISRPRTIEPRFWRVLAALVDLGWIDGEGVTSIGQAMRQLAPAHRSSKQFMVEMLTVLKLRTRQDGAVQRLTKGQQSTLARAGLAKFESTLPVFAYLAQLVDQGIERLTGTVVTRSVLTKKTLDDKIELLRSCVRHGIGRGETKVLYRSARPLGERLGLVAWINTHQPSSSVAEKIIGCPVSVDKLSASDHVDALLRPGNFDAAMKQLLRQQHGEDAVGLLSALDRYELADAGQLERALKAGYGKTLPRQCRAMFPAEWTAESKTGTRTRGASGLLRASDLAAADAEFAQAMIRPFFQRVDDSSFKKVMEGVTTRSLAQNAPLIREAKTLQTTEGRLFRLVDWHAILANTRPVNEARDLLRHFTDNGWWDLVQGGLGSLHDARTVKDNAAWVDGLRFDLGLTKSPNVARDTRAWLLDRPESRDHVARVVEAVRPIKAEEVRLGAFKRFVRGSAKPADIAAVLARTPDLPRDRLSYLLAEGLSEGARATIAKGLHNARAAPLRDSHLETRGWMASLDPSAQEALAEVLAISP